MSSVPRSVPSTATAVSQSPDAPHSGPLLGLLERVADRVAPTWPLDAFIAVNPLWGRVDAPIEQASAHLAAIGGARMTMDRAWYRQQFDAGRFGREHILAALEQSRGPSRSAGSLDLDWVLAALQQPSTPLPVREMVTDVVDAGRDLAHEMPWTELVVQQISRHCAAWFDDAQARTRLAGPQGLFESWRFHLQRDRRPELLTGIRGLRAAVAALPTDPVDTIGVALERLSVSPEDQEYYLDALLFDVRGWAGVAAHRRFLASQQGREDSVLTELLAIRIAWEAALLEAGGVAEEWTEARSRWTATDALARTGMAVDWVIQRALEIAVHAPLIDALSNAPEADTTVRPDVQAVFCIDVRSEPFRRALEAQSEGVETRGFAGFFGLPAAYHPVGDAVGRFQLPGPLAPSVRIADHPPGPADDEAARRRGARVGWKKWGKQLASTALSGFSFVESMGMFYGPRLVSDAFGWTRPAEHPDRVGLTEAESAARTPRLVGSLDGSPLSAAERAGLAAGILRGLSLTKGHARLVALVGHGAQTVNNPHAAGYDCGACCGHAGDSNARAVAALLNEPAVREGLADLGIEVPDDTWFIAALHDTTTDDITVFDRHDVPVSHAHDLVALEAQFVAASEAARRERAPRLGLGDLPSEEVTPAIRARARDWAQVRPEWGLAGNHSILIAPRQRSRHLDLEGRSFLHHYRWQDDEGFGVLEQLLTAPMVVSHWINFQYYASTVDNRVYGSGDKVLHNVVGGRLGVFEGNGGDLRAGLPMQSLHDGTDWVHEPIRLLAFVQAPREAIERVIEQHAVVRNLVEGGWMQLMQLDDGPGPVRAWRNGGWVCER